MVTENKNQLYIRTPLIQTTVSQRGLKAYLKLENTQTSGSFKARGISHHCKSLLNKGCHHFVSSSGGNAGLAVAHCGWVLGVPTTVFVPTSTPNHVIDKLRNKGATVYVKGSAWDFTNKHAEDFVLENSHVSAKLVHPFNHPEIWKGHSSIIEEIKEDLLTPPDLIILSVGGGGLLCGVIEGLHNVGWNHIPVLACETIGADSFYQSVQNNRLVTLPEISSIAKSLGALTVLKNAVDWTKKHKIIPIRIEDKEAAKACIEFSEDHKMIVEPACGAALAPLYGKTISELQTLGKIGKIDSLVVIVCGGHCVTLQDFNEWKVKFDF